LYRLVLPRSFVTAVCASVVFVAGCGGSAAPAATPTSANQPFTLRLGYLTNLTHGSVLVGLDRGSLTASLPSRTTVTKQAFNAGPAEVEAILGGALDAAYMGPSPAVSAYIKTKAIRVVAGATSGGAGLVIRPGLAIHGPADLKGKTLATPELGNTQDVALRAYLADHGLKTDPQGGGDVRIVPTANATALSLLQQGQIDGAWVPEPWLSRMIIDAHGQLLVNEADLWKQQQGRFATTELVVTKKLLDERPDVVKGLIEGQVKTTSWILQNSTSARTEAGAALVKLTNSKLAEPVLDAAWARLTFTVDPLAASFKKEASNAQRVGLVSSTNLNGILDLRQLNAVLRANGESAVSTAGLGSG
jgi:NitT/TauT family transport system substrate-binding protein